MIGPAFHRCVNEILLLIFIVLFVIFQILLGILMSAMIEG